MRRKALHLPHVCLLGVAALVWTWPLAAHFRDHIPGTPGDNFSFLWNLWWMRRVLAGGVGGFFRSTYLFYPFGIDLANHPHTALQGFVSATLLSRLSIITAENLYIVGSLFLNATAAYALAYDLTRRRRLALLAGLAFGGSPYMAAHLYGHFDLLSAWTLPLFALVFRHATTKSPIPPPSSLLLSVLCGVIVALAAYTAYYYVVYLALFALAYLAGSLLKKEAGKQGSVALCCAGGSTAAFSVRLFAIALMAVDLFVIAWIWLTGGTAIAAGGRQVSMHGFQNPLLVLWVALLVWVLARWKMPWRLLQPEPERVWQSIQSLSIVAATFALLALPLIVQAFRLAVSGRYVTQVYFWRSAPRGIDLLTLLTGNPFHPLLGGIVSSLYAALGLNRIEQVAWLGIVPLFVLLRNRGAWADAAEARRWKFVLVAFLVWALGPFLMIAGRDVGLPLPETLARFVPLVENARVPGRAMVGVYLALGVLMALRLAAPNLKGRPSMEWALVALLAADYVGAPMPLTPLDRPAIYEQLASVQDESGVIEVPFGIGDGLSPGIGSQDRRILYYATIHGHPLVGGYIGRMPPDVAEAYLNMPVVGNLLRLSSGRVAVEESDIDVVPFRYLVLDTATASAELTAYVRATLDMDLIGSSGGRELYAVQGVKRQNLRASIGK